MIQGVHHDNFDLWNSHYHQVNTFSIVMFRHKTNGTVTTGEFGVPPNLNTNQP